jgi:hypothetical protein
VFRSEDCAKDRVLSDLSGGTDPVFRSEYCAKDGVSPEGAKDGVSPSRGDYLCNSFPVVLASSSVCRVCILPVVPGWSCVSSFRDSCYRSPALKVFAGTSPVGQPLSALALAFPLTGDADDTKMLSSVRVEWFKETQYIDACPGSIVRRSRN